MKYHQITIFSLASLAIIYSSQTICGPVFSKKNSFEKYTSNESVYKIYNNTPLHFAVFDNKISTIAKILHKESDPNPKNINGSTPLHWAARYAKDKTIPLFLLQKNANPATQNNAMQTPLHIATKVNNIDVIKALVCAENINLPNSVGETPLMIAIQSKESAKVTLLLENKANPVIKNKMQQNALHVAAETRSVDIMQSLLEKNPQIINEKNKEKTPLDIAEQKSNQDVVTLLKKYGGKKYEEIM